MAIALLYARHAYGQSPESCKPYSYSPAINACYLDFLAPWWVVQNIQQREGDLLQGTLGEGWKLSLVTSNPTDAPVQFEYEIYASGGGGVNSAPVLASLNSNFVAGNGRSVLHGLVGATFTLPPHSSQRHWLISAVDGAGNASNDMLIGSLRARIYAQDPNTMDQVADKFTGTLANYVKDAATDTLTAKYLSTIELRRMDVLTNRAYTHIVVTPPSQRNDRAVIERAAIAVNNASPSPQTITIRLKGPSGDVLASANLTLAGGSVNGVGGESTAFLIDDLFPLAAFDVQNAVVFHGEVEVESLAPISLLVWDVLGEGATNLPWWSLR